MSNRTKFSDPSAESRDAAVSRLLDLDLSVMLDRLTAVRFAKSQTAEDTEAQADFLNAVVQIVCSQLLPAACGRLAEFDFSLDSDQAEIRSRMPDGSCLGVEAGRQHQVVVAVMRPWFDGGMSDAQRRVAVCLSLLGELFGAPAVRELQVGVSGRLLGTRFSSGQGVRVSMMLELKVQKFRTIGGLLADMVANGLDMTAVEALSSGQQ